MLNIFVGYDTRRYRLSVYEYQILKTTPNSKVSPLILNNLRDKKLYWRGEDKLGSTEFTFSRFLIPKHGF